MLYDGVYELRTIRKIFLMLVILKKYDYFNELQIIVFVESKLIWVHKEMWIYK